jgi:hypothetical protein
MFSGKLHIYGNEFGKLVLLVTARGIYVGGS